MTNVFLLSLVVLLGFLSNPGGIPVYLVLGVVALEMVLLLINEHLQRKYSQKEQNTTSNAIGFANGRAEEDI